MINREILGAIFKLNAPASTDLIDEAQNKINIKLPSTYIEFLLISNGLYSSGNLALHEIEAMPERNIDYEVSIYLPRYFMIGDDSGGTAILINESGEIFEVGMGVMSEDSLEKSANSIEDLLIGHAGKTMNER